LSKIPRSQFSAAEHALGYVYQGRFALLKALGMPEGTGILLEKADDVEFISADDKRTLASLKHKAGDDSLTNLDVDFWKSVRIWLAYYVANGRITCTSRFLLFTTAYIALGSDLEIFAEEITDPDRAARTAQDLLATSKSALSDELRQSLSVLSDAELRDFYSRITIFDETSRITEVPTLVEQYLRAIRRPHRQAVFERLEGWWTDLVNRQQEVTSVCTLGPELPGLHALHKPKKRGDCVVDEPCLNRVHNGVVMSEGFVVAHVVEPFEDCDGTLGYLGRHIAQLPLLT
jgi:hypothetical protein